MPVKALPSLVPPAEVSVFVPADFIIPVVILLPSIAVISKTELPPVEKLLEAKVTSPVKLVPSVTLPKLKPEPSSE